ncbi:mediator of RNA polymerase II transcription subunit 18 isoform X2 [Zeugodacus cucurbitae]|uniref:Mediator of RNA polymerase II transcription subunit 18 n=1 Tax=Zeugodacus cucurbitae TaxID=28588 RepID=A0A0A1WF95_ZEUCU|nr:mediator of RNA polymerase II transcription subunit 18 isoform X2 [Zeugodacus cucurbitae]
MAQITNSKELLSTALQSRIIPNQEFLLQGSILDSAVDHLIHRLRGLCDTVDASPEPFHDLEVCLSLRQPTQTAPLMLRVRRALDRDSPFQLRYIGQPELDRSRPTLVRSSIDVGCTSTILDFLTELGCRLDFEYVSRGYIFRKGRMKITVSKIKAVSAKQQEIGSETVSQSYLVELSVLAPNGQDSIGDEMRIFAEQLKPLVQLEKIDYKRLGGLP